MGVVYCRAAGTGDEGKDGGEFPQAAGVPAVLESVVVSFGCAGAGPTASSRHGGPPMGCEGYADLWVREGMEGPGRLREKASTPVPMHVRSVTTLRHPQTSERMWTRCEKVSVWGLPVHQGRSTTRRDGSTDPLPPVKRGSPMVTTVESRKGAMALSPPKGGSSASPAR